MRPFAARVADLARKIAVRLGLKPTGVQDVMLAGLLHDVGESEVCPASSVKAGLAHERRRAGAVAQAPTSGPNALMGLENLRQARTSAPTTGAGTAGASPTASRG